MNILTSDNASLKSNRRCLKGKPTDSSLKSLFLKKLTSMPTQNQVNHISSTISDSYMVIIANLIDLLTLDPVGPKEMLNYSK